MPCHMSKCRLTEKENRRVPWNTANNAVFKSIDFEDTIQTLHWTWGLSVSNMYAMDPNQDGTSTFTEGPFKKIGLLVNFDGKD